MSWLTVPTGGSLSHTCCPFTYTSNALSVEPYSSQRHHGNIFGIQTNGMNSFFIQSETKVSQNGDKSQAGLKNAKPEPLKETFL